MHRSGWTAPAIGFVVGVAAAVLAHAGVANAKTVTDVSPDTAVGVQAERELLHKAIGLVSDNDSKGALAALKAVVASPTFSELRSDERHWALMLTGEEENDAGDYKAAQEILKLATAMEETVGADWHSRFSAAYRLGDKADSVLSLVTIARRWPETLPEVNDFAVLRLITDARKLTDGQAKQFELLDTLYDAHWTPDDPFMDPSNIWRDLARDLLDRDQLQRARAVAEAVHDPYVVVSMRAERAFDRIVQAAPERFELDKVVANRIADLRARVAEHKDKLDGVNQLGVMLLSAGRDEESLKLLDDALLRALPPDGSKSTYADAEDQVIWTMDGRARVLDRLGRQQDAAIQWQRAARRPERGGVNVSQAINLAHLYVRMNLPKDALDEVADVTSRNVSPYGALAAEAARGTAYALLGDKEGLAKSIAKAREHFDDAPGVLEELFFVTNDLDDAAKVLIRRLANPVTRSEALLDLQDWRMSPGATAYEREMDLRYRALKARPDVQAAIAAVGRVETYDIFGP